MPESDCKKDSLPHCPNYQNCQLVVGKLAIPELVQNSYITLFCNNSSNKWQTCKRFITKKEIDFCPDFVLPDTPLTTEEIIDKFDSA